jgi:hypothetical protein
MNSIVNTILARLASQFASNVGTTGSGTLSHDTLLAMACDLGLTERKRKVGTVATLAGCEYVGADMREVVEATKEAREAAKIDAQIAKLTAKREQLASGNAAQA